MAGNLTLSTLVLVACAPLALAAQPVVVVLPLADVSGSSEAIVEAESVFVAQLTRRGWKVAPSEEVELALEQRRIRYLDSLTPAALAAICERFGASAVVAGSILAYRENGDPSAALAARMFAADGTVVWADLVAVSSSESEGMLGFGRRGTAQMLLLDAARRLARGAPKPAAGGRPAAREGKLANGSVTLGVRPQTYRSPEHARGERLRICVLPFASKVPEAGRIIVEILSVRLEATGEFDVVEPAEFREAMQRAQFRSVSSMTSAELAVLGEHLDTPIFLRGNVHTWREAAGGRSEVQIDMTLVDVAAGSILWSVTHQRRGSDYAGLLGRGTVANVASLADHVVSEAISAQHRSRPRERGRNAALVHSGQER